MTTIQIPSIIYDNGKIQKCEIIINSQKFNVLYQNNNYNVSQENLVTNQNNNSMEKKLSDTIPPKVDNQNNNSQLLTNDEVTNETKQSEINKNEHTDKLIELLKKQLK
tara:strand:+ start:3796 stop:4119 length:324 start_codon:yes stop_codon:yes gene_type:complete